MTAPNPTRQMRSNALKSLHDDVYLASYWKQIEERKAKADALERRLAGNAGSLTDFASAHEYFGLHFCDGKWIFREWAPNAAGITLTGDFSGWKLLPKFKLHLLSDGVWEITLPRKSLHHGMHYLMHVFWHGGEGDRIPAYARYVVQDEQSKLFSAVVWKPDTPYQFRYPSPSACAPLIYEAHVGIAQEEPKVGSYDEFRRNVLPEIARKGYNTVQLMAVMEHPYYGSFGYHVANYFAISSRFGTPEDFKALVDDAHRLGLRVIIDLVHSHSVRNEAEGLAKIDGSRTTYFHDGARGEHPAWDSLCFDYDKIPVLHFLLSNCRFYLDEYHIDGFRFDGITSMLYLHHGLYRNFTSYSDYFNSEVDEDAVTYLTLVNRLIHALRPDAITVAEDVSGMPGVAAVEGIGFDYRMAMGVTDLWFKLLDQPDDQWNMFTLFYELTNRRRDERSIGYVECHDQAIVGGKTAMFQMADAAMYDAMHCTSNSLAIDRAMALHKMMRLATAACAGNGYLNFMGNEFGHPEWIDLPREGNNWSLSHARRQWSLEKNPDLRYRFLGSFDVAMLQVLRTEGFFDAAVQCVRIDNDKKVLIFERRNYWFIFNFNPVHSFTDYEFEALPGSYSTVLDSDDAAFGGFALRQAGQRYFTMQRQFGTVLSLYLPARTALVLLRENVK